VFAVYVLFAGVGGTNKIAKQLPARIRDSARSNANLHRMFAGVMLALQEADIRRTLLNMRSLGMFINEFIFYALITPENTRLR
jgi:hypothetical protein